MDARLGSLDLKSINIVWLSADNLMRASIPNDFRVNKFILNDQRVTNH